MSNGWPGNVQIKDFPKKSTAWLNAEVKRVMKDLSFKRTQLRHATYGFSFWRLMNLVKGAGVDMLEHGIERLQRRLVALLAVLANRMKSPPGPTGPSGPPGSTASILGY